MEDTKKDPFIELEGFKAKQDLTHLSQDELADGLINHILHLAHSRGVSIADVLQSSLDSFLFVQTTRAVEAALTRFSGLNESPVI